MSIKIVTGRPQIFDTSTYDSHEVKGTTSEWDWLFDGPLKEHRIASIKLVRQLNPGMGLLEAKQAHEAMHAWYRRHDKPATPPPIDESPILYRKRGFDDED